MKKISQQDAHILIGMMAGSALVYEMILAATLGLLFGDSIFYFSVTIAFFILFMGVGSYAVKWIQGKYFFNLILAEIAISISGALCSAIILQAGGFTKNGVVTSLIAGCLIFVIGFCAGLEVPLLYLLSDNSKEGDRRFGFLLLFDYLGALLGALIFSFILLPQFDLLGSGALLASLNLMVLAYFIFKYKALLSWPKLIVTGVILSFILCAGVFNWHEPIQKALDQNIFQVAKSTEVIEAFRTKYQKVTVTLTPFVDIENKYKSKIQIQSGADEKAPWIGVYLNRFVQTFSPLASQTDLYHHAFVHPAMVLAKNPKNILILGGGDGLPAKEVLKYPQIQRITNVDLDGEWVEFAKSNNLMKTHNFNSLNDPKVLVIISDAFQWVRQSREKFDVVLVDFPEGVDLPLARSYSLQFLRDLKRIVNEDGIISFQVDFFNNPAYWSIVKTMMEAGFKIIPHRALDPGDDNYGLILLSKKKLDLSTFDQDLRKYPFINPKLVLSQQSLELYRDEDLVNAQTKGLMINTFFHPSFLYYYRTTFPWDLFIGNND